MTINKLIQRLQECGDEKFRDSANVRIMNHDGDLIGDELDICDIKDNVNSVDIYIPY